MKKIMKIIGIIILVIVILVAVAFFAFSKFFKTTLGEKWEEYEKLFSMQTQTNEELPPLENIEQRTVDIKYINKDGSVETRSVRLYLPEAEQQPVPLIYVPHYEMAEDAAELRRYLDKGWAVASPTEFDNAYNGELTDDDLVFNNAALYTLRGMSEFDRQRIAIVGGSAGGYTALMLSALQMGNCATIATAPISNVYFNFYQYFPYAMKQESPPFFLSLVAGMFTPILENFPDENNIARWEALSAVGIADCFSSPLVISHVTSDILVPIDQTTRQYTYEQEGDSMPEGFSTRLPSDNPGVLGHSLADELPVELTSVTHIPITDPDENTDLYYDPEKLFNLNIYDDGPTQATGSHRASTGSGIIDDTPYLEEMFSRSLSETEQLMSGKLLLLLKRYQGNSVQLPAHVGVDDTAYGSLAIYQQEVIDELAQWVANHSLEKMDAAIRSAVNEIDDVENGKQYLQAWQEIQSKF